MGYNPIEDFQRKDLLESGDPEKIVRGTELQIEFNAISADFAAVRNGQNNLNYLPLTGGTVNGDISAQKITATEFIGGTLSATNVSGTTFAGNGAALTGMKMSQLTDVKMTSVQRDDILVWNGSAWESSDVYNIVSPLTYAGVLDITQPAPSAKNGDTFVNGKEGFADASFKGLAGLLILEGKFVIYDGPTDEWNSPGNSADAGVNYVRAGSGIEVDSIKPSEPVVSIDRSETDAWYLAADAETSKWETVADGIAYNDGNVGIGNSSPSSYAVAPSLVIGDHTGFEGITLASSTSGTGDIAFADGSSGNAQYRGLLRYEHTDDSMQLWTNSVKRMTIDVSGNLTATGNVTAYSDERLKSDVETLDGSKVYNMRGVSFTKDGEAGSGVIAQELQKVAPELVHEGGEYLSVAYGNLVGYLIEAVKDLKAEVDELKEAK